MKKGFRNGPKFTWPSSKCELYFINNGGLQQLAGEAYVFLLHPLHTHCHVTRKPSLTTPFHQTNIGLLVRITSTQRTTN